MDNLEASFRTSHVINEVDIFSGNASIPHNIDIVIGRVPIRVKDGYSIDLLKKLADILMTHVSENGWIFLISYPPSEAKYRRFEIGKVFTEKKFLHIDTLISQKKWISGKRTPCTFVNMYDQVMIFRKTKPTFIDKRPIKKFMGIDDDIDCPGNIIQVSDTSLNDNVSYQLATLLIQLSAVLPAALVMDPFGGNVTILEACLKLGHSLTTFEPDGKKFKQLSTILKNKPVYFS